MKTMKYDKLDKSKVQTIRALMEEAFTKIADKTGVHLTAKTIRFTSNSMRTTVEGTLEQDGIDARQVKFNENCYKIGLAKGDYGKKIYVSGMLMRVTGVNPRRPKFPVSVERISDGAPYKISKFQLTNALASSLKG